jgi:hypothetical protein
MGKGIGRESARLDRGIVNKVDLVIRKIAMVVLSLLKNIFGG